MKPGIIVIGYQGIGKSTYAATDRRCIDLESSCMWVDGQRSENWHEIYCNFAEDLARQGYIVFTASHAAIRERLKKSKAIVYVCGPSIHLREAWIERLKKRYDKTGLDKDSKAYLNAVDRYAENIQELLSDIFPALIIEHPDGSIADFIPKLISRYNL